MNSEQQEAKPIRSPLFFKLFREISRFVSPPEDAWFAIFSLTLICFVGYFAEFLNGRHFSEMINWPITLGISVNILVFISLISVRNKPQSLTIHIFYYCLVVTVNMLCYFRDPIYAQVHSHWAPFQGHKLGIFIVAFLSPSFVAGVIGILIHTSVATATFMNLPSEVAVNIGVAEPWIVFLYTTVGLIFLTQRVRRIVLENQLLRSEVKNIEVRKFARLTVRLSDLMNTPLQVLDMAVLYIEKGMPLEPDLLNRIKNNISKLHTLNNKLNAYQKSIAWTEDDVSFDAESELYSDEK